MVVAENGVAFGLAFAFDERHPIVVADFVAEVANERPVWFVHLLADALAFDRVGFVQVDRDETVGVAGEDGLFIRVGFEIELQRLFVTDIFGRIAKLKVVELIEELPLGEFQLGPAAMIPLDAEVGHDVVESAGSTESDARERIGDNRRGTSGSTGNTRLQTASTA